MPWHTCAGFSFYGKYRFLKKVFSCNCLCCNPLLTKCIDIHTLFGFWVQKLRTVKILLAFCVRICIIRETLEFYSGVKVPTEKNTRLRMRMALVLVAQLVEAGV